MRQSMLTITVVVYLATGGATAAHAQQSGIDPDSYVTRFEKQKRLVYEPKVEMVERLQPKSSWIPFRNATGFERKLVPVVTWAPRWTNEVSPVTERIGKRSVGLPTTAPLAKPNKFTTNSRQSPTLLDQLTPRSLKSSAESSNGFRPWSATRNEKTHRVAQRDEMQLDGVIATGRIPTPAISARPVDDDSAAYGGVQKLSEDVPSVGMRLRPTR